MMGRNHLSNAVSCPLEHYLSGNYGDRGQFLKTSPEARVRLTVSRQQSDKPYFGQISAPASDDAFLVTISLHGHRRRSAGNAGIESYQPNSLQIRSLAEDYFTQLCSPFDFLFFHVTREALDGIAQASGSGRISTLSCTIGTLDPIVANLGRALIPALTAPSSASSFFIDHIALAITTHLAQAYGGLRVAVARQHGRLSRAQERRAKEFLMKHAGDDISIAAAAAECGLSRSYFIKAFKETTGTTPHKWLLQHRVQQAKQLLAEDKIPIAEIAAACGFADQSHLTRVFSNAFGIPPGAWRRENAA